MFSINDLTDSVSRTWESLSQGWRHLINRAEKALTRFGSDDQQNSNIPVQSPRWGLINADVYDDAEKVIVKLEVPGLEVKDLDISLIDNMITVTGEKRFQREETKGQYRVLECAYGRFSRSIPLGYEVDADTAIATYDKGILKVELKKQPHQKRIHIKID